MASRRTTAPLARTAGWAASGAALSLLGIGAGVLTATNRWNRAPDATGRDPLGVPVGGRRTISTDDGATIRVISLAASSVPASGRPIVLSHCWTGDHRVWGPVARRLVDAGHDVVLYDQRGHGGSTVGTHGYTLSALGADLRTVVETLDLRDVVIAGHSMGGMSAQAYAIEHPEPFHERVAGLALVATASSGLSSGRSPTATFLRQVLAREIAGRTLARRRLGPVVVRNTVGSRPSLPHLDAVCETFIATAPQARADLFVAMEAMDFGTGLATINVPTVVVCGTRDWLTPSRHSRRLVDALPDARLELLPDAGHMLPFEAPVRVAELIAELG